MEIKDIYNDTIEIRKVNETIIIEFHKQLEMHLDKEMIENLIEILKSVLESEGDIF